MALLPPPSRFRFNPWFLPALLCLGIRAGAFLPPSDTAGPLKISIGGPAEINTLGSPLDFAVSVQNSGATTIDGTMRLAVIDDWRVTPPDRPFSVPPHASVSLPFDVIAGASSYAALYPVHAYAVSHQAPSLAAHAMLITHVSQSAVAALHPLPSKLPLLKLPKSGSLPLDEPAIFLPSLAPKGANAVPKPVGWTGIDPATGTLVELLDVDRGGRRHALAVHPPWRDGWGDAYLDYRVALPDQTHIALNFATAIRDNGPGEPPSDGVEFRVLVSGSGVFKTLFTHFSAAKLWEAAQVDLSAYAGREITLRLVTDPGPAHDTTCDQSYWAGPTIVAGPQSVPEPKAAQMQRRATALALAAAAQKGGTSAWSWKLESEAGLTGAAIAPGPRGLADAFIAFTDGSRTLVFDGFNIQVDGRNDLPSQSPDIHFDSGRGTITTRIPFDEGTVPVQVAIWAEKGVLRIAFSMPGVKRNFRGQPRFTSLAIGPASELAHRVYAGFGNVIQDPGAFDLAAGGFTLSTRHVGIDFANGLSLLQATDVFPDSFQVNPQQRTYSLVAHHDATFTLVPSMRQAFAAARVYHALTGFKPAGGVATLQGRICLDQWSGDYRQAARDLEKAALYGLTDAVFVEHVWQRWGYDYRLPDIYPPGGSMDDFLAMVAACKSHGILFSPHDNYIDFYPDATGFTYDDILFNEDGTPQLAWFNKGRDAQSYRWSPLAFGPSLEANLQKVKTGFAPTAYFVDVFSAMPPIDFYDRQGRFYPKSVTADRWGAAFDRIRKILGGKAPTISEAGQDGLIGHLDAGEADHAGWQPGSGARSEGLRWSMPAADAERIPWHDMASHGSFVLLGGGLGGRYAGGQDEVLHGYGSDDYLCTTVLGGRNPMCDGPFSRRAVMTYWLLHDLCNPLAHSELLSDEFAGDDIHRQTTRFSNGGAARVNRGKSDWTIDGQTLPPYGFIAKASDAEAGITRRDGLITAYAKNRGALFVDARPANTRENSVVPKVAGVDDLGNRRFRLRIDWQVLQPVPAGFRPFVHFVGDDASSNEGILFQGGLNLDPSKLALPGTYASACEVTLPAGIAAPADISIRFGLYGPGPDGTRLHLLVPVDRDGRARGGMLHVAASSITWTPEPSDPNFESRQARLNTLGKLVDFGSVATNGAFRLLLGKDADELIPLPNSASFKVLLRLNQLNAAGRKIASLQSLTEDGIPSGVPVDFHQIGKDIEFETSPTPFAYRITFQD